MKFIRTEGTAELEAALVKKLNEALATGKKVLWLVPGGSNIPAAARIMSALQLSDPTKLTITMTDERYGDIGHKDSNQVQLKEAGFDTKGATFIPYLSGVSLNETVRHIDGLLKEAFSQAEIIIGFFGMGADGHIAGILPHSLPAEDKEVWVVGYDAPNFQRITLTPFALSHLHSAFVGAFGGEKLATLATLKNGDLPIVEQPAQLIKKLPEVYVFNDQIGDTI